MKRFLVLALLLAGCARSSCAPSQPALSAPAVAQEVMLPRAPGAVTVDGKLEDEAWKAAWRSPALEDAQGRRQPHAEVRLMADDRALYVAVYAADEDLHDKTPSEGSERWSDRITLEIGPMLLVLTPTGGEVPAGVQLAVDVDGSVDQPQDEDEEWVSELAIPWALLGKGRTTTLRVMRMDAPRGEHVRALAWPLGQRARLVFAK